MNITINTANHSISEIMYCNDTPVLKYEINRPVICTNIQGKRNVNEFYAARANKYQTYNRGNLFKLAVCDYRESIENGYEPRIYETVQAYTVTNNQNGILSLYTDTYEYMGGAHGNTTRTSQSWCFPGGTRIRLQDLFPGNCHYRAVLIARIVAMIAKNPESYFEEYEVLAATNFNDQSFYLTPDGFAIYYQPYDIAPHASGIPVFEFTYEGTGATPPCCK